MGASSRSFLKRLGATVLAHGNAENQHVSVLSSRDDLKITSVSQFGILEAEMSHSKMDTPNRGATACSNFLLAHIIFGQCPAQLSEVGRVTYKCQYRASHGLSAFSAPSRS